MAIGSLLSIDLTIIEGQPDDTKTLAAVEASGPDLRSYGRCRRNAFLSLANEAERRARASRVDADPSFANAASCWLLDYLGAVQGRSAWP